MRTEFVVTITVQNTNSILPLLEELVDNVKDKENVSGRVSKENEDTILWETEYEK